jgi:membrane protein implicated in regulation of membrane protease activity
VSEPDHEDPAVVRFVTDVGHSIAIDLTTKAVYFVVGTFAAAFALLIWRGGSLPAWVTVATAAVALLVGLVVRGRTVRGLRRERGQLEQEHEGLEEEIGVYVEALVRHEEYSGHVAQALDALQRILSGEVEIEIPHYIEVGVLQPARDLITEKPAEHIRLSILLPRHEDTERWRMAWAAGHSITGKAKYEERIVDTLSRHAFESGQPQHWKDTELDSGFRQNPMASADTRSLISLPVRRGEETLGVFNVVSSEPYAFDPAEEKYIASLGALISVAVGVWVKDYLDESSNGE